MIQVLISPNNYKILLKTLLKPRNHHLKNCYLQLNTRKKLLWVIFLNLNMRIKILQSIIICLHKNIKRKKYLLNLNHSLDIKAQKLNNILLPSLFKELFENINKYSITIKLTESCYQLLLFNDGGETIWELETLQNYQDSLLNHLL